MEERRPSLRVGLGFLATAVVLVVVPVGLARAIDEPEGFTYLIEIPKGTASALAAGTEVEIFPADLDLRLRDILLIVNKDDVPHTIGQIAVGAGEQVERTFGQAVSISGFCSLHTGGVEISVG
ncbi:MAG: hypothetical protein ACKVHU_15195 [Acidimicrobiales bacterium]|jgi:hypothetical protein